MPSRQRSRRRKPKVSQALFAGERIAYQVQTIGPRGGKQTSFFATWESAMKWANELATKQLTALQSNPLAHNITTYKIGPNQ